MIRYRGSWTLMRSALSFFGVIRLWMETCSCGSVGRENGSASALNFFQVQICTISCVPRFFSLTEVQLPGPPQGTSAAAACCPFLAVGTALAQVAVSLKPRALLAVQATRVPCLPQLSPCNRLPQCREERSINPTLDVAFASKLHPVSEREKQNTT